MEKVCRFCGKPRGRGRQGNLMATCGAKECVNAREAERKRNERAGIVPGAETAPVVADAPMVTAGMALTDGPVRASWGKTYETVQAVWADCLIDTGIDEYVSPETQDEWRRMLNDLGL